MTDTTAKNRIKTRWDDICADCGHARREHGVGEAGCFACGADAQRQDTCDHWFVPTDKKEPRP